ncbi:hypothetical protein J3A83DRAFT_3169422 [Scleroderma citrinum]
MVDVEGIAIFMATYGINSEYLRQESLEPSPATNTDSATPDATRAIKGSSPSLQSSACCDVDCEELDEYQHSAPRSSMSVDQCDDFEYEHNNQRSRSSNISVSMGSEDLSRSSSAAHEDTEPRSLEFFSDGRSLTTESSKQINAHIIPTRGVRSCLALPVFVVADEGTIVPLVRSTLYQRHVLGIMEPVVGFIGSRTGTVFRVIIGWLDSDTTPGDDLPAAHVAFNPNPCGTPNPLLGTFDLVEPLSAFCMAQFIMQRSCHGGVMVSIINFI